MRQFIHGTLVQSASITAKANERLIEARSLDSICFHLTQIFPGLSERNHDGKEWTNADESHCSIHHTETLEGSDNRPGTDSCTKCMYRRITLHLSASLQCISLIQIDSLPYEEKQYERRATGINGA